MIEEYTSEEANASHIAAPPVQELISLFGTADVLDSAPEVYNNNIVVQKAVTGDLDISSGTAIVLAHYEYPPGALSRALEGWKDVVRQIEESENGTRAYTVLATEGVNDVRTVEIYESWDYLQDAHLKDSKVKAHAPKSSVRLRCVHGFFGGGRTCSKI